jgi:hypothetical protein
MLLSLLHLGVQNYFFTCDYAAEFLHVYFISFVRPLYSVDYRLTMYYVANLYHHNVLTLLIYSIILRQLQRLYCMNK